MREILKKTLVPGLLLCLFLSSGMLAKSYPIRCRGGLIDLEIFCGSGVTKGTLTIYLTRARSHTYVPIGKCAWMDRTLNSKEIPVLKWTGRCGMTTVEFKRAGIRNLSPRLQTLKKLIDTIRANGEYVLYVENRGSYLAITKLSL